jgi:hypothetical protein
MRSPGYGAMMNILTRKKQESRPRHGDRMSPGNLAITLAIAARSPFGKLGALAA